MIELGRVVAAHPEGHCIDVILYSDGRRLAGVRVMSPVASTNTGLADLHAPETGGAGGKDPYSAPFGSREQVAVIAFYQENPICLGFLFPSVAQAMFERENFKVDRHASDVYQTIDKDGNIEICHPSGTYVRIAESPAHEDLTGKDFDKKWKIARNTQRAVHVHLTVANGGAPKATLNIDPDGNVSVWNTGSTTWHSVGDIQITSDTHIGMSAPRIDLN